MKKSSGSLILPLTKALSPWTKALSPSLLVHILKNYLNQQHDAIEERFSVEKCEPACSLQPFTPWFMRGDTNFKAVLIE